MKKIAFFDRYRLTQAVVDLIKTNTRRIEKSLDVLPLEYNPLSTEFQFEYKDGIIIGRRIFNGSHVETYHLKPRYKIGEVVAVAQAYKDKDVVLSDPIFFEGMRKESGWTNKMFVRADLMPHRIRITDIKAERLQDISDVDAIKEGIYDANDFMNLGAYTYFGSTNTYKTPHETFAALIDRISGKGTWERNPWVFAYEFELVK